jgi:ribosomal protein S18 acetylase RimI-like enzyme
MFVKNGFRGQPQNIGQKLLDTAIDWAIQRQIIEIYLGTVPHYYAAHRFYEKNQFYRVPESKLPINFDIMQVDKYFYCLSLEGYKK